MGASLPRRHSSRLHYWDYSQPGHYFLTFCGHERQCLFGRVSAGEMHLSEFGRIAEAELLRSLDLRAELAFDTYMVMPNHIHLIAVLSGKDSLTFDYSRAPHRREKRSVSSFLGGCKGQITARINTVRQTPGTPVLQRNFHDHIIRNEWALNAIRQYIANNPQRWELDCLHPDARPGQPDELTELLERDARYRE